MPGTSLYSGRPKAGPGWPGLTPLMVMRAFARRSLEHADAIDRVRAWTRGRFGLRDEAAIMVAEVACAVPGCPPIETVIVFWSNERRHHYKIFKPVADVVEDDLPPRWFMGALAVPDGLECDCC